MNSHINLFLENQTLKGEFAIRDLDLSSVWQPTPEDPELENRQLLNLLDWVQKYKECGTRKKMEAQGYHFPPIDPDLDPDTDWLRFERWIEGKPIRYKLRDKLPADFMIENSDDLTDVEIEKKLDELMAILAEFHYSIDLQKGVPARLVYEYVLGVLDEEFEIVGEGWWHIDGCDGYCPDCFQRPWCETGSELDWPEDEDVSV